MLRMYLLQIWFNLADEALEEHLYDSYAMRKFMGLDFSGEGAPDATTPLNFRHLLEGEGLQKKIFEVVNELLEEKGKIMRGGTIIDATIIEAPTSTKNGAKSRDPPDAERRCRIYRDREEGGNKERRAFIICMEEEHREELGRVHTKGKRRKSR